jgi:uncharacterized protein (TIGR02271 family)
MRQTVVGVFEKYSAAQHAAQTLQTTGFADSVFITDEVDDKAASSTDRRSDEGVMAHVRNFFAELFGSGRDEEVGPYAEAVRRGGAVVKVEVDEEEDVDAVREALQSAGAVDIEERMEAWRATGSAGFSEGSSLPSTSTVTTASAGTAAGAVKRGKKQKASSGQSATEAESVIPVVKETLEVGKRTVGTGGVRVYAHTVSTPVEESVELESEHAKVERRPVNRAATSEELSDLADKTIEVRETAEKPVVAKEVRVVEEVVVGKEVEQRTERIRDNVRSTEVEVERLEADAGASAFEDDETTFRQDFTTRYASMGGTYEDYEPAYRYGHSLAADQRYAGRAWEDIEADAQRDWEARHPGSTWDRFKAAVRRGWERVTS